MLLSLGIPCLILGPESGSGHSFPTVLPIPSMHVTGE